MKLVRNQYAITAKKLKLSDVEAETGISFSTLQRIEADTDIRVGYQDIEALARFYDVSADYLFGLTDLQQYRNIEIDKLRLSDDAIAVLKDSDLNNRLISEFVAHPDFQQLLTAMEIYIDRKEQVQSYLDTKQDEKANKAKAILLCKQLGLNASKLTDEEWRVLMITLENSERFRQLKKRK